MSYKKTFHLTSPGDGVSLEIKGEGTWTFNHELHVTESLDYQQDLHIKDGNVTVIVPVTIKYRRLSDAEWAKIESDRLAAIAKAKAASERKAAEAKAMADGAIEGAQLNEVLTALKSGPDADLLKTLKILAGKTPRDDSVLAGAIRPHVEQGPEADRKLAKVALAAFAPEFKRVHDLNVRYRGRSEVKDLGTWIAYDTPLPTGLIVPANKYRHEQNYYPGEVVSVSSNGLVKVNVFGGGRWTEDRLREDMYLAPPEVEQPKLDEKQLALVNAYRDQVDASLGSVPEEVEKLTTLNRAYRDHKLPIPKTGGPVPPKVKLPKFTVLAGRKDDGKWYQAHVSSQLPDGRVNIRFSQATWDSKMPRERLRFPPAEFKSPNLPPIVLAAAGAPAFRTWTDNAGKFTVIAKFVSADGDMVEIHRQKDGRVFKVALSRLSESNQKYVEAMNRTASKVNVGVRASGIPHSGEC